VSHNFAPSEIVREAPDKVTFVVMKSKEAMSNDSFDEYSLPSLPNEKIQQVVNQDGSRVRTREVANNDGSQTIIEEFFDAEGRKKNQTTRRRWLAFDGSWRDASFSSVDANGRMMVHVRKSIRTEIIGLRLESRRTHRGPNTIVVSQVFPSGMFARTPLSVGDHIVTINDIDFAVKPNLELALRTLSRAVDEIKVVAMKPSDWIERREQRISQPRQLVETFTIDPPRSQAYQFDVSAYDDSVFGYNSTKKVSLKDISASERLGMIVVSQYTRLGVLLVVKDVARSSRLATSGLRNGDVIVSINGIDMKSEPDAGRAMSLIQNSIASLDIEYQRIGNLIEEDAKAFPVARLENFLPDGTKTMRTETRNPDGSILVRIEEVGPAIPVDAALTTFDAAERSSPDIHRVSPGASDGIKGKGSNFVASPSKLSRGHLEPVTFTVNKLNMSQSVDMDLTVVNGALCVARVGRNSLLLGKPLLPGDTVLEINKHNFRKNPSLRQAQAVLSNPTNTFTFTILRTSLHKGIQRDKPVSLTPKKKVSINCFKCGKKSRKSKNPKRTERLLHNQGKAVPYS